MIILSILFFITAILYSSVGFGGGSTYLALMLIWDIQYYIFPIIALFCNIIVVSGNSINYVRSGNLNVKLLLPYLLGSIPFAFFGASIVTIIFGVLFFLSNLDHDKRLTLQQAFLLTALSWLSIAVFGSLPFVFSDLNFSPLKIIDKPGFK